MDDLIDILRGASHNRLDLWLVILGGLVLAWFERRSIERGLSRYDAWWTQIAGAKPWRRH
jgi:hypothetical protein